MGFYFPTLYNLSLTQYNILKISVVIQHADASQRQCLVTMGISINYYLAVCLYDVSRDTLGLKIVGLSWPLQEPFQFMNV